MPAVLLRLMCARMAIARQRGTGFRKRPLLRCLLLFVLSPPLAAAAQPTNVAALQELGVRCLAAVPDTARAFRLDAPERLAYLRPALVAHWQAEGRTLFVADTAAAPPLPRLRYRVEAAGVAYARAGRRLRRTVTLGLHYSFTAPDGRLLADARCHEVYADTLARNALAVVEADAFPEARAEPPPPGWLRRYLEPALLTAATAVTAYLFFTLRSQAKE